jgi:FemAB family
MKFSIARECVAADIFTNVSRERRGAWHASNLDAKNQHPTLSGIVVMEWRLLDEATARDQWNIALAGFADCNAYQSYEWGEYRRAESGVAPYRWAAYDDSGKIAALFQGALVRKALGRGIVTALGGPVGDLAATLPALPEAVRASLGLRGVYLWAAPNRSYRADDALVLRQAGWHRALHMPSSGLTMWLDLARDEETILAAASSKWRQTLRRGLKAELRVERWHNPPPNAVIAAYQEMAGIKGVAVDFSESEVGAIATTFGDRLVLFRCTDASGTLLALRGCLVTHHHALDFFAATTAAGRETYASYAVFWAVIRECIARGVRNYDLNHIDPRRGPGVYQFKRGSGAAPIEYLGDWEWASSDALRLAVNGLKTLQRRWRSRNDPPAET